VFNEFVIDLPVPAQEWHKKLLNQGFVAGLPLNRYFKDMPNSLLICATEKLTTRAMDEFVSALKETL